MLRSGLTFLSYGSGKTRPVFDGRGCLDAVCVMEPDPQILQHLLHVNGYRDSPEAFTILRTVSSKSF